MQYGYCLCVCFDCVVIEHLENRDCLIFFGVIFAIVSIISFVQADNIKKRVERRQMIREAIFINKLRKRKSKARRKRR